MRNLALFVLLMSPPAFATTYLQPGESRYVNRELVVCGGGQQQEDAWMCSCFDKHGKNHGNVTVYAFDKRDAVYKSSSKCKRTFNNWDLNALPLGCFKQN